MIESVKVLVNPLIFKIDTNTIELLSNLQVAFFNQHDEEGGNADILFEKIVANKAKISLTVNS